MWASGLGSWYCSAVANRSTPHNASSPDPGLAHAQRRKAGGARREASERVVVRAEGSDVDGWTLNLSRGGVRLVVEDPVQLGGVYDLVFAPGEENQRTRPGRIVWVQDEPDGQVAGIEFLDLPSSQAPPRT